MLDLNDSLAGLEGNVLDLHVVDLILVHLAVAARAYRMIWLVQFTAQDISPVEDIHVQLGLPCGVAGSGIPYMSLFNALPVETRQAAWEHQILMAMYSHLFEKS